MGWTHHLQGATNLCVLGEARGTYDTYSCLEELNAVGVGRPSGNKEVEGSEYVSAARVLKQVERQMGRCIGGVHACQCSCAVEGSLQGVVSEP
jgi:hypothetical protein